MSATDWVLLAIVAVSALFGLMRGFIGVAASLLAWVLAGWAAFHFGADVALLLARDGDPARRRCLALRAELHRGAAGGGVVAGGAAAGEVGRLSGGTACCLGWRGAWWLRRCRWCCCCPTRCPRHRVAALAVVRCWRGAQWMRGWLPDG